MSTINSPTTYIKFATAVFRDAKELLPDYSSKFSRKDFTQPQLVSLAAIAKRFRWEWRELEEALLEMPRLRRVLGLKKVPDFSTVPKFLKRIGNAVFNRFFRSRDCNILGVDASGFSSTTASPHYEKRCEKRRPYLKGTIAVDLDSLMVQGVKTRRGHAHDTRDFGPLVERCKFNTVVADKGYDDEKLHRLVHKLGAESIIPVRERKRKKVRGRYRKKLSEGYDKAVYHQRSKVETVFSIVKRVMGDDVASRSTNIQKRELKIKLWAYNIDRMLKISFLRCLSGSVFG